MHHRAQRSVYVMGESGCHSDGRQGRVGLVEGLVGDQRAESDAVNERRHADGIGAVAGQQAEVDKVAERVGRARISVAMPPLEGLWPGSESPFCALAVAVDLDDGGIDHGVFHIVIV